MALLSTILALALVDSLNPTSIAAAGYLAITGRARALRIFVASVYLTYLAIALALTLVVGPAARGAVTHAPAAVIGGVQVGAGVAVVAMGVWAWRHRGRSAAHRELRGGSASALGVLATFMDLPTAVPLVAAAGLIVAANLHVGTELVLLLIYDLVYVGPLLAIAVIRFRLGSVSSPTVLRALGRVGQLTPALSSGLRISVGCLLGSHGIMALA